MKKQKQIFSLAMVVLLTAFICSCNQEADPSLYQIENKGATPVISGIVPDKAALAGVAEITISGSNFSSVKEENFVYFGTAKATVLEASPTALKVQAPTIIQNELDTKIAVHGAENFSNVVKYNLIEAVGVYYAFAKGIDDPVSVAADKNENVYVYLSGKGVKKITTDGKISDFAPKGTETFFSEMKFGANNVLYGLRILKAIFQVEEGKAPVLFFNAPNSIASFDFDANKNIWAAGSGGTIYSVTSAKASTTFAIDYTATSVRIYDGYLYIAGYSGSEEAIYRYKINSATSLGNKEKYFDIGAKYGLGKVKVGAITFSSDGQLFIGTDQEDAFICIKSDGSASNYYPGLISPSVKSMIWGTQKNLFYIREFLDSGTPTHTLVRIDMQKTSAPYYGNN